MRVRKMMVPGLAFSALTVAVMTASAIAQQPAAAPVSTSGAQPGHAPIGNASDPRARFITSGYLGMQNVPDSLKLNPPPPQRGSVAQIRDEEAAGAAVALRGSPRWELAKVDADLFSPTSTGTFSCAAGFAIGAATTPKLNDLLRRAAADMAVATMPTKRNYQRQRPFMVNGEPTCTPQDEAMLRQDGSYPSGHSAIGYGWGLLLAELVPDRSAQLVARGRAFGDSRRVCNVHWLSDVEEGRVVATAVVARLHADVAFQRDLKKARDELKKVRSRILAPDCSAETAALGAS